MEELRDENPETAMDEVEDASEEVEDASEEAAEAETCVLCALGSSLVLCSYACLSSITKKELK
jgi:hypothetical protein